MAGDENNDRYRAGQVDKELEIMNETLKHIVGKLDDNIEWQRGVDTRLATGVEKFGTIEGRIEAHDDDIEALKNKDRGVLAIASTVGGGIGSLTAVLIKIFGG